MAIQSTLPSMASTPAIWPRVPKRCASLTTEKRIMRGSSLRERRRRRRVEAHQEVVPAVVVGLMRFGGAGQEEGPPVIETPDHARGPQDYRAGVAGDSGGREGDG
ncbi:hypothetical protein EPUS_02018 [Endocarpon pusillum Z07020]|uniref:Uncharacterized protein n=1 Tax=Endocarpon pusillum (strain Z07020 / HMAS-L-300199) TaxID=1263415 RepID=U1GQS9_ENDPU|nr:uncharacterized protein EPUS_02018 [Endocarpon pusillum Z07020]ERF74331.1 hypothetical protein EPUS_02018 [Endocarpon pusillum Z07020]